MGISPELMNRRSTVVAVGAKATFAKSAPAKAIFLLVAGFWQATGGNRFVDVNAQKVVLLFVAL